MSSTVQNSKAPRLSVRKERVLQLWEERVRQKVPAARRQPTPALLDSLPDLLDTFDALLTSRLSSVPEPAVEEVQLRLAAQHGRERAQFEEYSLDQVISEYETLRQVLVDVLGEREPLPPAAMETISDFALLAIRNAATEFVRLRDAERDAARADLEEACRDLDRRVRERVEELRLSEVRFRHFVESVKDYAIFTLDPEGTISSWNEGCMRMKGYRVEEAIGRHFCMLYPEEGNRREEPMSHLRSAAIEGRFRGEGMRVRKNGNLFLADVCITPIYDGETLLGYTKVVQDLSERNLLMQERDLSRTDVDRMRVEAEYRERFVATLTHDLRSPLSAAKSAAQLIVRFPAKHDKVRAWAFRIEEAVDRTDRMISDLLDASRLQAGEPVSLKLEKCDLLQIVREACEDLSTRHGDRFVIQAEGTVEGVWNADGLRRVVDNLLSNAIKYGEPSSPIGLHIHSVEDRVLLSVHNHGTIIPVEEQRKLFEPFHRTRLAQASEKRGWGLGLSLVKAFVEAHHGVVKVESFPIEGTTFTIDLPQRFDTAEPVAQP
jgi:PAS domain S-box-containing protein